MYFVTPLIAPNVIKIKQDSVCCVGFVVNVWPFLFSPTQKPTFSLHILNNVNWFVFDLSYSNTVVRPCWRMTCMDCLCGMGVIALIMRRLIDRVFFSNCAYMFRKNCVVHREQFLRTFQIKRAMNAWKTINPYFIYHAHTNTYHSYYIKYSHCDKHCVEMFGNFRSSHFKQLSIIYYSWAGKGDEWGPSI